MVNLSCFAQTLSSIQGSSDHAGRTAWVAVSVTVSKRLSSTVAVLCALCAVHLRSCLHTPDREAVLPVSLPDAVN